MGYFFRAIIVSLFLIFFVSSIGSTSEINYTALAYCESSHRTNAISKKNAVGVLQITQPCLDDFNAHTKNSYTLKDMLDPRLNKIVSMYYLEILIPQYLQNMNKNVTVTNRLHAYHDGIGNVKKGYMSHNCKYYIAKYWVVYYLHLWRSL
jgi:hypothetical protein